MEAQLWTVSSSIYLDVSVARFHQTSLTCLGPDKRPACSERAALFEHASIFQWKTTSQLGGCARADASSHCLVLISRWKGEIFETLVCVRTGKSTGSCLCHRERK